MRREASQICAQVKARVTHAVARCVKDPAELEEFMTALRAAVGEAGALGEQMHRKRGKIQPGPATEPAKETAPPITKKKGARK